MLRKVNVLFLAWSGTFPFSLSSIHISLHLDAYVRPYHICVTFIVHDSPCTHRICLLRLNRAREDSKACCTFPLEGEATKDYFAPMPNTNSLSSEVPIRFYDSHMKYIVFYISFHSFNTY